MRGWFILAFLANVALTAISYVMLPDRVAIHFGADGMADGWGPNSVNALFMTFIDVLLFCVIYFSVWLIRVLPARWINLPNKDYWLCPANQARSLETIRSFMWRFGTATLLFLFVVGLLALHANLSKIVRLDLRILFPALALLIAYTLVWTVAFFRAFRLPPRKEGSC